MTDLLHRTVGRYRRTILVLGLAWLPLMLAVVMIAPEVSRLEAHAGNEELVPADGDVVPLDQPRK